MSSERHERVKTVMQLKVPDRIPWAVWAHFPAIPWLKYYSTRAVSSEVSLDTYNAVGRAIEKYGCL